jgi:hypothetical protein
VTQLGALDLLKSKKSLTSEQLRAGIATAEAEAKLAGERAAELVQRRGALLLSADDAALDTVERQLQLATRESDRADAALSALRERLTETEAREKREALDRTYAAGEAALTEGLKLYRLYGNMAVELRGLLAQMAGAHDAIVTANYALRQAHDPRQISDIDATARPQTTPVKQAIPPPWLHVRLPSSVHPLNLLHPVGTDTFGLGVRVSEQPSR